MPKIDTDQHQQVADRVANIAAELAADSAVYFPELGSATIGAISVSRNPYSNTARIRLDFASGPKSLFVKLPVIDEHNRDVVHERLLNELDCMRTLHERMPAELGLSVIKPVAYFEAWPALVTEEAVGPTLQERLNQGTRLLASGRSRARLSSYVKRAGQWLAKFQSVTKADDNVDFRIEPVIDYCRLRLDQLQRSGGRNIDLDFSRRFIAHLRKLNALIPAASLSRHGRHNDFAPHNMIAANDAIHVLDFTMYDQGEACFDIINFWERLEVMKTDPRHRAATLAALQHAFLDGYGQPIQIDDPQARIARCQFRLTRMASMSGVSTGRWRQRLQERRLYAHYHRWIANELGNVVKS